MVVVVSNPFFALCVVKFVLKVEFTPILTFVHGSGAKNQNSLAGCQIRSAFIC